MPLTRRYTPELAPGEICRIGLDYSFVLPKGVTLATGALAIFTNAATPADVTSAWTISSLTLEGRMVWAQIAGGVEGTDYQLRWQVTDSDGFVWPRTCLLLCAQTS
jgi:hypothetical protein